MHSITSRDIAVSTTPKLEGWSIKSYLGVASAHVVAGTNVFSDIAASFSDVFGGRSQSYQDQLEDINEAVINDLKKQAIARGGTALVGLSVDHDQISGGNRQLLMVSATATVVVAKRDESPPDETQTSSSGSITAREVRTDLRRRRLVATAEEDPFNLEDDDWDFLIKSRIPEVALHVRDEIDRVHDTVGTISNRLQKFINQAERYFLSIPDETAKPNLYHLLGHGHSRSANFALDLIKQRELLDWEHVRVLLTSDIFEARKRVLRAATEAQKSRYTEEDLEEIERLITQMEEGFSKRGEVLEVEKEGMFSSGTKEVWQLEDDRHIDIQKKYDPVTGKDIYGFTREETRPEDAIQALKSIRRVLRQRFTANSAQVD